MGYMRAKKGFTLIEAIVVIAVVAILAAILTPTIAKHIDDSRISRAKNEIEVIGAAMSSLYKDVGNWPIDSTPQTTGNNLYVLETFNGLTPTMAGGIAGWTTWGAGNRATFRDHLVWNDPDADGNIGEAAQDYLTTGQFAWNGPYQDLFTADPWRNKYYSNVLGFWYGGAYQAVFVLSAGPNGVIDTDSSQLLTDPPVVGGDDIARRMR